jgi:hypothetical protein
MRDLEIQSGAGLIAGKIDDRTIHIGWYAILCCQAAGQKDQTVEE